MQVLHWSFDSISRAVQSFYSRFIFQAFFITVHVHIAIEVDPMMILLILLKLRTFTTFLGECLSTSTCSSIMPQVTIFHHACVLSLCWVILPLALGFPMIPAHQFIVTWFYLTNSAIFCLFFHIFNSRNCEVDKHNPHFRVLLIKTMLFSSLFWWIRQDWWYRF